MSQKGGYVVEDGVRTDYAVGEMKSKVMGILNFKERIQPKTSSLIYRYAIFTPQEMMKEVLTQRADKRLDTLRRAFGVEEYRIARNNADILSKRLLTEIRVLNEIVKDLPELRDLLEEEQAASENDGRQRANAVQTIVHLTKKLTTIEGRITRLRDKREHALRLEEIIIPGLKNQANDAERRQAGSEKTIGEIEAELEQIRKSEELLASLKPDYQAYLTKKEKLGKLEESMETYTRLDRQKAELSEAIAREGTHLQKSVGELEQEVKALEGSLKERTKGLKEVLPALRARQRELESEIKPLDDVLRQIEYLNGKSSESRGLVRTKEAELEKARREWESINKIGVGAPCPRCKQKLSKAHLETVGQEFRKEFQAIEAVIRNANENTAELESERQELENKKATLEAKKKEHQEIGRRIAKLEGEFESAGRDKKLLDKKQKNLQLWKLQLQKDRFALKERKDLSHVVTNMERLNPSKKRFETLKQEIKALEQDKIEMHYTENHEKAKRKKKVRNDLKSAKLNLKQIQREICSLRNDLATKETKYGKLKGAIAELDGLEKIKKGLEAQRNEAEKTEAGLNERLKASKGRISGLEREIKEKEAALSQKEFHEQIRIWLNEYLAPCLEDIEVHVLAAIREEFNGLFQRWFGSLIETGDIAVRIDENFTPIVEQSSVGYELDVASLSGGERTTLALAYRLALNLMVKRVCNAMHHSNLLILDEPTDGFSKEQLFKLRDVLREVNCEQVIMVSHENELESFVDRVYRVTKDAAGVSKVSVVA